MTIIRAEKAHAINGVEGRMFAALTGGRAKAPGTFCSQTWGASRTLPQDSGWGKGARMTVEMRFDDQCGNGHNTFAMTADIRIPGRRDIEAGGCLHDEIAKYFPELAHLIRWHLCSTDGPVHYAGNAAYFASNRDHQGKTTGEPCQWSHGLRFNDVPYTHRISEELWQFIRGRHGSGFQTFAIPHKERPGQSYKFAPKYSLVGYSAKEWHEGPFEDQTEADEFCAAINTCRIEFLKVPTAFSEGKARELDKARRAAVWPDATDEELCAPDLKERLAARLPALIDTFRSDMDACGFLWSSSNK